MRVKPSGLGDLDKAFNRSVSIQDKAALLALENFFGLQEQPANQSRDEGSNADNDYKNQTDAEPNSLAGRIRIARMARAGSRCRDQS